MRILTVQPKPVGEGGEEEEEEGEEEEDSPYHMGVYIGEGEILLMFILSTYSRQSNKDVTYNFRKHSLAYIHAYLSLSIVLREPQLFSVFSIDNCW